MSIQLDERGHIISPGADFLLARLREMHDVLFGAPRAPLEVWEFRWHFEKWSRLFEVRTPANTEAGDFSATPMPLMDVLLLLELASSRREAREFIKGGAIKVNGQKVTNERATISEFGGHVIRRGARHAHVLFFGEQF